MRTRSFLAASLLAAALCSGALFAQNDVTTWHNDIGRTGQNTHETALTQSISSRAQNTSTSAEEAKLDNGQAATHNWAAGNPLKIGLLKWYQANQTTSFSVGKTKNSNPYGVAFDGANIWTVNSEGTVTKLRTSDGTVLGNFEVGGLPTGIAFDGANLWVTDNSASGRVSKVRASDGKVLGVFPVGRNPGFLAFDGEDIWVADSPGVTKLRASDGKNLGSTGVAFDGANIWVALGLDHLVLKF
jgi:hypothetical protein